MLLAPFLCGWLATGEVGIPLLLFTLCMVFFFFLHDPLFTLVRVHPAQPGSHERKAIARRYLVAYAVLSVGSMIPLVLVYNRILLIPVGLAATLFLVVQTYLMYTRSEKTVFAELLVVVGLTSTAPLVRYVLIGRLDELGVTLWILNIAFFTSSIFYVKMRVERFARKGNAPKRTKHCLLYHVLLILLLGILFFYGRLHLLVVLAFVPIVIRAIRTMWIQEQRLNLMRIGLTEIAYTCLFVILLSAGL